MSIWITRKELGWEDEGWHTMDGEEIPPEKVGGEVRTYASGFSNHYPTTDDKVETRACIDTSSIPSFCVPGHRDETEDEASFYKYGPWLRVGMHTSRFEYDGETEYKVEPVSASVVMDEEAVRTLRDELNAWLETDKVYPKVDEQP